MKIYAIKDKKISREFTLQKKLTRTRIEAEMKIKLDRTRNDCNS